MRQNDLENEEIENLTRENLTKAQSLSLLFGVSFIIILIYALLNYPELLENNYSFYKTILAIACSGVAAIIPGFLQVKYKAIIQAGGAIAVFVLIFIYFPAYKTSNPYSLRVLLTPTDGSNITETGKVIMQLGGEMREGYIDRNNSVLFENIPSKFKYDSVRFSIRFTENYELVKEDSVYKIQEGNIIRLPIKLHLNTLITGTVFHADIPLSGVSVRIGNLIDTTNNLGRYKIQLEGRNINSEQNINFYKRGYRNKRLRIYLQTLKELDIVLER